MTKVAWTTYEDSAGAKPRLVVLFQPVEEAAPHTEDDVRVALQAAEKQLRSSWLLPGKGQTLESMKKPAEESRHITALRKDLATQKQEYVALQESYEDLNQALRITKIAVEEAQEEGQTAKNKLSSLESEQKTSVAQVTELTRQLENLRNELAMATKELSDTKKLVEVVKTEMQAAKEQHKGLQDVQPKLPEHPMTPQPSMTQPGQEPPKLIVDPSAKLPTSESVRRTQTPGKF